MTKRFFLRQKIHNLTGCPLESVFRCSEKWSIDISKSLKLKRLNPYLILVYTIDKFVHLGKYKKIKFWFFYVKVIIYTKNMSLKTDIRKTVLSCLEVIKKFMFLIWEKWIAKIRSWWFNCQNFQLFVASLSLKRISSYFFTTKPHLDWDIYTETIGGSSRMLLQMPRYSMGRKKKYN